MGKMVYPVLTADGILVGQQRGNGRSVCHVLTIYNNDGSDHAFKVRQGTISGTVIWEVLMKANTAQNFTFYKPLQGLEWGASNQGDLFMDVTGSTVGVSGVCEQGVIPSG